MNQMYRDYVEGTFVPSVEVTRREDNGHYTARSMGLEVTHHDQAEAVNRLNDKIQEGLSSGELHPFME
jgi:hypothetical protein